MPYAKNSFLSWALALTVALPVVAQQSTEKPSVVESDLITLNAKVVALDKAARLVTLQDEQGNSVQIVAGDEVRNFDQIDVGDRVITKFYRAIAIEVTETEAKTLSTEMTLDAGRVAPGQKPGGLIIGQITVTAEIMQVDKENQTVTIKRQQQGEPSIILQTVAVRNPAHLENIDPGDMVIINYQQSVAVSVQETQ